MQPAIIGDYQSIRIHDVVMVKRTYTDPDKSWYGGEYIGVIIALDEESITIKNERGDEATYKKGVDGDYTTTISLYSEIEFRNKIEKAIKSQNNYIDQALEKLDEITKWQHDFLNDVSLFARLTRWFKGNQ